MTFTRIRVPHILPLALFACVGLVPAGCGSGEDVNSYKVPKSTEKERKEAGFVNEGPYRILGAMYPAESPEWFFKLPGPTEELTKYEADFDKLLASVSLPPNGPPEFTTPEGWKRGPGRAGIVVATIRTPDGKYEVTLTSSTGGVYGNLKRWATDKPQLGGKGFGEDDIAKVTTPVTAKGVTGLRVDLRGPNNPASKGGGPMMPPGHP
jgi:hypothetical protein